jgi:hypothetical protein
MRAKDWLDLGLTVVNTGSNLSTAVATNEMQDQQARAAEQRKQLLALRDRIFNIKQVLHDALALEAGNPLIAAAGVRFIELQIEHSGLSPSLFEDLSDKEYVNSVVRDVRGHSQRLRSRLSPADQANVEAVTQWQLVLSDLEYAIQHSALYKQLVEARAFMAQHSHWGSFPAKFKHQTVKGCLLPFGVYFIVGMVLSAFAAMMPNSLSDLFTVFNLLLLLCTFGYIVFFNIKDTPIQKKYNKLKQVFDRISGQIDADRIDAAHKRFNGEDGVRQAHTSAQQTISAFYGSTVF